MERITINDVARRAGVSKSTVSHVINNTRFVEKSTRQRVLRAVEEMGYRPSSIARSLISKQTKTIGLLISDVGNPFYSEVIRGVEEISIENNYSIFLCNTNYKIERGISFIQTLSDKSVDGVLIMSSRMSIELVQELAKHQIPAVVLDWEKEALDGQAATLSIEFSAGIHQAIEHLVELGHRRIAHISGPLDIWTAQKRRDDFIQALVDCDLDPSTSIIVEGDLRIDGGRAAFLRLIEEKHPPTAIFAANDLMALGVLWAAREKEYQIPNDISVIGLDNIELASQVYPALTTVALPRFEIGSIAMSMLLEIIHTSESVNSIHSHLDREVTTYLIIRQSTS